MLDQITLLGQQPLAFKDALDRMDALEVQMLKEFKPVVCPLQHFFTPGMYVRSILMLKGTLLTSRIHTTEHPYVILSGDVSVWTNETGIIRLKAPHFGITKPNTKRVIYMHEDTIWNTFHPNPDNLNVEEMEKLLSLDRENPLFYEQVQRI